MKKLEVTFYKEVFHGMEEAPRLEKVVFEYQINESLKAVDNINAAFDKAVELGLNPFKNISFKEID
mgnify:CR=1 FL=1